MYILEAQRHTQNSVCNIFLTKKCHTKRMHGAKLTKWLDWFALLHVYIQDATVELWLWKIGPKLCIWNLQRSSGGAICLGSCPGKKNTGKKNATKRDFSNFFIMQRKCKLSKKMQIFKTLGCAKKKMKNMQLAYFHTPCFNSTSFFVSICFSLGFCNQN